jgi:hypothetical protein
MYISIARRAFPGRRHVALLLAVALAVTATPEATVAAGRPVPNRPARTVSFDGLVYSSAYVGSTIYLGGSFQNAIVNGKKVRRKWIAAVDARSGQLLPWAPTVNGNVLALAASGSSLYVTGKFSTVGGQPRDGVAAINRTTGAVAPFKHTMTGLGNALAVAGGRLYLGGLFSAVNGHTTRNLAAFKLATGALDTGFRASADAQVRSLTVGGSRLYVGGKFKKLNSAANTARFAALRVADGQVDTGFRPGTPYEAFGATVAAGKVFAALGGPGGRVAAYRHDGGLIWSTVTDGDVQAITYLGGTVYAGGHFTVSCPVPSRTATSWCPTTLGSQPKFASFDQANGKLTRWNPKSNGRWGVLTMDSNPALGVFEAGGEFTKLGGANQQHFAQFKCQNGCARSSRSRRR